MNLWVWLVVGVPENLALAGFALAVLGTRITLARVAAIGLGQAVVILMLRSLPIQFGVHTVLGVISLALWLKLLTRVKLSRSLLTALVAMMVLALLDIGFIMLITGWSGIDLETALTSIRGAVIVGMPHVAAMVALTLLLVAGRKRWGDGSEG